MLHKNFFRYSVLSAVCVALLLLVIPRKAIADSKMDEVLKFEEITKVEDFQKKPCSIVLTGSESRFMDLMPKMVERRLIGHGLTQQEAFKQRVVLEVWNLISMAGSVILEDYEGHKDLDRCHIEGHSSVADDYGKMIDHTLFSFDFDRATFNKIDWDHMVTKGLREAPGAYAHGGLLNPPHVWTHTPRPALLSIHSRPSPWDLVTLG